MLDGLLPDEVRGAWGDPREDAPFGLPAEEALIERAVDKRKREFRKARACARSLLAEFGVHDFALLAGAQREPLWPDGLVGSVTHTDGMCAVVVGSSFRYAGIGIDVEPDEPLTLPIAQRVCVPGEMEQVSERTGLSSLQAARLIFSAKEAFYKCQFCVTQRYLGFGDVRVEFSPGGCFSVSVLAQESEVAAIAANSGRWAQREGFLLTSSWLRQKLEAT
ncbi:MAG: 4'-phosphopantetheinyl transferase superfamily protein [Polyangiaceae bacterium]